MAHEVNNALQVISGSAELLEARDLDPSVQRRVEIIKAHAGKAAATINQLRSYSRQDPAVVETADLASLVEEAVAMCSYPLNRARVGLSVERSDRDPYAASVERKQTLRLFLNLLFAAEEACRSVDGGRISIRLGRGPQTAIVTMKASAGGARPVSGSETPEPAAAVTTESELWAASQLATLQKGTLDLSIEDASFTVVVTFQAVEPKA